MFRLSSRLPGLSRAGRTCGKIHRMMGGLRRAGLLTALLVGLSVSSRATTMVALSTEELFQKSDVVAVVQVRSAQTVRSGGRLVTHVETEVSESFKGTAAGASLTVLTLGGTEGRIGQQVEGAARFVPGESCVVFLRRVADGVYHVVGMEQGKLALEMDSGGVLQLRRSTAAQLVIRTPGGGWEEAAPLPAREPAEPFFATLRRLAGGAR
jgi:hypothetical protein